MIATTDRRTRRLFLALWPNEGVREALARVTREAVYGSGGRPLPVTNWHTTLVFLGSVSEDRMTSLVEAADSVPFAPFQLKFDRLEHWAKVAVLCATASQPPFAAEALAQNLQRALMQRNFTLDRKSWRAHITLARKVIKPHIVGSIEPVAWSIEDFALVESATLQEGAHYTVLERWPKPGERS